MQMATAELSCQELVELLTEYFEGTLSSKDRVRFEQHLAPCDGCQAYVEQMQRTIRMLGKLSERQVPAEAEEKLLQVFRDWKKQA